MTQQEKIKLCNKYGIKYDSGCRTELKDEMIEYYGAVNLLEQLVQALSDDEALACFEHIDQINR